LFLKNVAKLHENSGFPSATSEKVFLQGKDNANSSENHKKKC
jgi:hypothetical protein